MFHPNGEIENPAPRATQLQFGEVFELPPPRQLPPGVTRRIRGKARKGALFMLLFGGIFMLAGLPIFLVFFPYHLKDSLALSAGPAATARGTVDAVEDTSYKVNSRRVHQLSYTFEIDGQEQSGQCYLAGGSYAQGCPIQVRYLVGRPELNCVAGGTFDPAGNFTLFIVIFPIVGLAFFIGGLWSATVGVGRELALARDGFLAEGRVTAVERTSVRVNRQYRYRVAVDFDALGPHQMSYFAYGYDVERARRWMESNAVVRVIYDRQRPEHALVLDHVLS